MWYLISATRSDDRHVFICGKEYIFGRKDCDIVLSGDPAVSRRHASIQVTHLDANLTSPDKLPFILLKDLSKFGTWVSGKRVEGETPLKNGDQVFFGSPKSSFTVAFEPLIVTTSCLDAPAKRLTRTVVSKLGGYVVSEWREDCSLLVMNSISVTIKVVCAIVSQKHIVSPQYLEDYSQYVQKQRDKPDPNMYLPTVIESQINSDSISFLPDERRQNLFHDMKFIFLNPMQCKKMSMAIELAGGTPLLLEEKTEDHNDSIFVAKGTVVMVPTEGLNVKEWYKHVEKTLTGKKKKMILDSEIGYAILFCSTESHCNPDIANVPVLPDIKSQSLATEMMFEASEILAPETEASQLGKPRREKVKGLPGDRSVVEETFMSTVKTIKRESQSKKQMNITTPSTSKRSSQFETTTSQPVVEIKDEPATPRTTQANIASTGLPPATDVKTEPQARSSTSPSKKGRIVAISAETQDTKPQQNTEIPSVRKRTRSPSPSEVQGKSNTKRSRVDIVEDVVVSRSEPVEEDVKEEEVSVAEVADTEQEVPNQPKQNVDSSQRQLPDGFFTTRKPIKSQTIKHEAYRFESDLPEKCVVTTFVDLVTSSRKTTVTRGEAVPEGYVKWKGKLVKNFKKFKKVGHAGSNALPNIIGGSDLQVHEVERSKELESWFKQSVQAESQLNEQEQEAQDMFNQIPKQSKVRRGK